MPSKTMAIAVSEQSTLEIMTEGTVIAFVTERNNKRLTVTQIE